MEHRNSSVEGKVLGDLLCCKDAELVNMCTCTLFKICKRRMAKLTHHPPLEQSIYEENDGKKLGLLFHA